MSRFDWYAATFDDFEEDRIPNAFVLALGGTITRGRGKMGYAHCHTIERDEKVLARVFTGAARPGEVHVVVSGEACDRVVPFIRRMWPEHRVSRVDVATDFRARFEELDAEALAFANERGLSYRLVTDSEGGATRYLGAPSSEFMVRIYKKTEQMRKVDPVGAAQVPEGLVRVEKQVRPSTRMKGAVARMSADEVWGIGKWPAEFARRFLDLEVETVATQFRRPTDWSRALHWLGAQYGPAVARRAQQVGRAQARAEVLAALGLADGSA